MKTLQLTVEQLKQIVEENEIIAKGCYGILYKLDEDTLYCKDYKDIF